jgi:hypothetical protein
MVIFLKILVGLSVLIFIIGMIKPKWILFWMKQPDRLTVSSIALIMFMAAWTGIAKLTLKPKPQHEAHQTEQKRSPDQQNELQLDSR